MGYWGYQLHIFLFAQDTDRKTYIISMAFYSNLGSWDSRVDKKANPSHTGRGRYTKFVDIVEPPSTVNRNTKEKRTDFPYGYTLKL